MRMRSSPMPKSGAITRTTSGKAIHDGRPQDTLSCHPTKAAIMPIAPWAKLKTPVVEYTTTSPVADSA